MSAEHEPSSTTSGADGEPEMLTISIIDPAGTKKTRVETTADINVEAFTDALVERMRLPTTSPDGRRVSYRLSLVVDGQLHALDSSRTLWDEGVRSADTLRLQTEMVGGGRATEDVEITIHGTESVDSPRTEEPFDGHPVIVVGSEPWGAVLDHAESDVGNEVGGVLFGEIFGPEDRLTVRITHAIEAELAEGTATSVHFTPDAWAAIEQAKWDLEIENPLVGWYHTHPGFTAFLSSTDYFMHEHFFSQPWHLALVIDPINAEAKFFRWEDGAIAECPTFLIEMADGELGLSRLETDLCSVLRRLRRRIETSGDTVDMAGDGLSRVLERLETANGADSAVVAMLDEASRFDRGTVDAVSDLLRAPAPIERAVRQTPPTRGLQVVEGGTVSLATPTRLRLIPQDGRRRLVSLSVPLEDCTLYDDRLLGLSMVSGEPSLVLLAAVNEIIDGNFAPGRLQAIAWGAADPPDVLDRIVGKHRALVAASLTHVYELRLSQGTETTEFVCVNSYQFPAEWSDALVDIALDRDGTVYALVSSDAGTVWRLVDGEWELLVDDPEVVDPGRIAVGENTFVVLEDRRSRFSTYFRLDGQPLDSVSIPSLEGQSIDVQLKGDQLYLIVGFRSARASILRTKGSSP